MSHIYISPSILSADFGRLAEEIRDIESAGCDWVHLDIMDAHFVPNLTMGPPVIKWIRKSTQLPLDAHLMIENPIRWVEDYRSAGADMITFHVEAADDVQATINKIRNLKAKVGLSLRPNTPVKLLEPFLSEVDLILVMTVEPGFGGQSFMPEMVNKVKFLRSKFKGHISVDGGITAQTAAICVDAGADVLVAGTAIFGQKDRKLAVHSLLGAKRSV
ncbi:MAG: ribulose-phosphate 3-epimerase [Candidatus Omnitrophica bacterium]|nr:ribulose-phosphate 3-epimerase [Candidatus Omnitrophota bacterium]